MTWQDIKFVISQSSARKSFFRAFQNLDYKNRVSISGQVIDLGAKNGTYEYHDLISKAQGTKMTFTDLYPKELGILKINFDKEFPIKTNTYNDALLFNVLEHVWDTRNVLSESYRILSPGGNLYGLVPFMIRYHKDPTDYWRFTDESLCKLLGEAGFEDIEVHAQGIGCFTVSINTFSNLLRFKLLISLTWLIAIFLDNFLSKIWPQNQTYFLGLFFKARKPSI